MSSRLNPPVVIGLLCLLAAAPLPAAERYIYRETRGTESDQYAWTAEPVETDIQVTFAQKLQTHVSRCHPDGSAFQWSYKDQTTDVQAQRVGNEVVVTGRRDGEPLKKKITIDDEPWYQPLSYSLRQFVRSGAPSVRFWLMRSDTLDAVKLKAERAGRERIPTLAGEALADKVRISTTGLLSGMWSAHYWFDTTTGVFLRYEGVNGFPGTPKTVIQLLNADGHAAAEPRR